MSFRLSIYFIPKCVAYHMRGTLCKIYRLIFYRYMCPDKLHFNRFEMAPYYLYVHLADMIELIFLHTDVKEVVGVSKPLKLNKLLLYE